MGSMGSIGSMGCMRVRNARIARHGLWLVKWVRSARGEGEFGEEREAPEV